ncbi:MULTISPECIES: OmpA family protein [unclassified Deinococcus]|uniref:OmpA/MotB family protein n=1 Tax=unclassified Deinococcus TaxID=2623546 RepID=UPI001E62D5B6|nr:OmpA family protein [Deinococcus sp. 6GRE01]MCD0161437.1 OmpA family protein [Deinococcus sp. 6YEL10]MCD0168599.1 OmpA family protein [Deinococcus sp. 23YEL01]MCD0176588.1 OmpA family protein [Deinococcus sp. 14RED07]
MTSRLQADTNPYIAFSDLTLNLVFVLIFFLGGILAVGQAGWEQVRYRNAQEKVVQAVRAAPLKVRPLLLSPAQRNDPPGAQRWVFRSQGMFQGDTAKLSPAGQTALVAFARVLRAEQVSWKRVRIEGHTQTSRPNTPERWDLSAVRASAVAEAFYLRGGISPNRLAIAARGGQTSYAGVKFDPRNERVEIVVEYAQQSAP